MPCMFHRLDLAVHEPKLSWGCNVQVPRASVALRAPGLF
jgi:hypothetical protein